MKDFNKIWEILQEAFPPDERRSREEQKKLLRLENYHIDPYYQDEELVGFLCYWYLGEFIFVEHLAVDHRHRGKGYGRRMMKKLLTGHGKKVVLEVEYPEDENCQRRIRFYEALGFKLNTVEYFQPSYGKGKEAVPLLLMTYPEELSQIKTDEVIDKIYKNVYRVDKGEK